MTTPITVSDVVYDIDATHIRVKHSNATINELSREETIEAIEYMIATVCEEPALVTDSGGELNPTTLAELTCEINDLYFDDRIPEDLFEIAFAVCTEYEQTENVDQ